MTGVLVGALAFLVIFWVDALSLNRVRLLKPVLWVAGAALLVAGALLTVRQPPRVALPIGLRACGWTLAGAFFLLLVYSLFVEVPFVSAYARAGRPGRLVRSGTYALCRHPGVLWLAGTLTGLFLATGSLWLLPALAVWTALDVLYVVLQERLFFPRLFGPAYARYQRDVPMLLPTLQSIRACAGTIFRRSA